MMPNKYLALETPRSYKVARASDRATIAYPPTHYTKDEARQVCEAITNALNASRHDVYVRPRRTKEDEE